MASDARLRPFRALDHTRLLDGSPLGVPQAVESNPLLEEIGFERDVTFDASAEGPELVSPNKTQEGADEASRQAERTHETPDALLPRATAETLAALLANQRRREPEDGDVPFFAANRAPNVAAGAQAAVLEFELEPETELYIASIGTDATDGQDEVEITLGGRLAYRGLFSPMTLAEARAGRCFDPPRRARKKVQVKIKNNGAAPASFTVNLRGWTRALTNGTLDARTT